MINPWDFVDLYGQTHRNIQQKPGGLDKSSTYTMQIVISFVYFRFLVVLFCFVLLKILASSQFFSLAYCHFLLRLEIKLIPLRVRRSQLTFIKPLECCHHQCQPAITLSFQFALNHMFFVASFHFFFKTLFLTFHYLYFYFTVFNLFIMRNSSVVYV